MLINQWNINTIIHTNIYKDKKLIFIRKNIRQDFNEVEIVLYKRGITLLSNKINKNQDTYIYFIYRPTKIKKVEIFWN